MSDRLDSLAKIFYGKSPVDVFSPDGNVPIVGTGGIFGLASRAMFESGIVVARKGSLGIPHLFKTPFWPVDTTYAVIPCDDVNSEWLYYCLLNFDLKKLNEATGVPSINRNWLAKITFPNPGKKCQKKIASILSTIDIAIEKTEALIAKYQQIKAGLMHDLFTRGVLPNGQLRPPRSQAPELYQETDIGWIPRDWTVVRMVTLAEDRSNATTIGPFGSDLVAMDYRLESVPVVFVRDIKSSLFQWNSNVYVSKYKAQQLNAHSVRPGEILATKMGLPPCISCVYPEWMPNGIVTADIIRLSPDKQKVVPEWLATAVNQDRVIRQVAAITAGVTRPKVTLADFRAIKIATPQLDEQKLITSQLNLMQERINKEQSYVIKLQKQKLGLMQDLLTGKVPVQIDELDTEVTA